MFWKPIPWGVANNTNPNVAYNNGTDFVDTSSLRTHALVDQAQNQALRAYEASTKEKFDNIEQTLKYILTQKERHDFNQWANSELFRQIGITLDDKDWNLNSSINIQFIYQDLFAKTVFAQFLAMSEDFFVNDPLAGQKAEEVKNFIKNAGFHAVGVTPCSDGRLAHFISYGLRLPYTVARRKAHAGALFDISESVRNWVFVEHTRFRSGEVNQSSEPTRYMKIAVYHFSKASPCKQGCAAHGSDDNKAAEAALNRLRDFRQAITNRFDCGSTVETILIGMNTDDDSLKIHIPNSEGLLSLDRFIETDTLYKRTLGLDAVNAKEAIKDAIEECNKRNYASSPQSGVKKILAWFVEKNFSQIEYVNQYHQGCYQDIGHAERFIGIGSGFEEVQLRNLSYYSFLDTVEEGANDVDVGIKIFKGLNVKKGNPIPIIIRCDYDGRVPGSKDRAEQKANRIEKAIHNRYEELSKCGLLKTLPTLRDYTGYQPAEKLSAQA